MEVGTATHVVEAMLVVGGVVVATKTVLAILRATGTLFLMLLTRTLLTAILTRVSNPPTLELKASTLETAEQMKQ